LANKWRAIRSVHSAYCNSDFVRWLHIESTDPNFAATAAVTVLDVRVHLKVDFEHRVTLFPIESFQRTE